MVVSPARVSRIETDGHVAYTSPSYEALEFSFAFTCHDRAFGQRVASMLAPLQTDKPPLHWYAVNPMAGGTGHRDGYELSLDGAVVASVAHADAAAAWLLWHLNVSTVREGRRHVVVHGGAVSAGGIGIVLPAPMHSGKTTLVAGLVQRGLAYLSDEVAAVRRHDHVLIPFPKALAVKPGSEAVLFDGGRPLPGVPVVVDGQRTLHVTPDALRPGAVGDPCTARMIVVPHYRAEGRTELVPITSGDALVALVVNAVNLDVHGGPGMRVLAETARRCMCFRLDMSDLDEACRLVLDAAAAARVLAAPVIGLAPANHTRPPGTPGAEEGWRK